MKNQKGFTVVELVFGILFLVVVAISCTFVYGGYRVWDKYVNEPAPVVKCIEQK